jgi:hypothetical protein
MSVRYLTSQAYRQMDDDYPGDNTASAWIPYFMDTPWIKTRHPNPRYL